MIRGCILLLYDAILIRLAIEDFKERKIRDKYNVWILVLTGISAVLGFGSPLSSRLIGMFLMSVPMVGIALVRPGSFGGGDVKLAFASGAFLGWRGVLEGTVYGIVLASIYCLWLIFVKKESRDVQFALGPYLSAGYILVTLFKV